MELAQYLSHVLNNYAINKEMEFKGNELSYFIRNEIKEIIPEFIFNSNDYKLKASAGNGNWASVPWFAIFDKNITQTAEKGVYLVYLFANDYKGVYLSLNQGWTHFRSMGVEGESKINTVSTYWKNNLNLLYDKSGFTSDGININVEKIKTTSLPKGYELGNIYSKYYTLDDLSDNSTLLSDLITIKEVFNELKATLIDGDYEKTINAILNKELETVDSEIENKNELVSTIFDEEGQRKLIYTYKYERKPHLRRKAIEIHGTKCKVCGMDFEEVYGDLGKGFIEVHHIKPLYSVGGIVNVDPTTDLVPVCPNCHRMLHRVKGKILTVEELKEMIHFS